MRDPAVRVSVLTILAGLWSAVIVGALWRHAPEPPQFYDCEALGWLDWRT